MIDLHLNSPDYAQFQQKQKFSTKSAWPHNMNIFPYNVRVDVRVYEHNSSRAATGQYIDCTAERLSALGGDVLNLI